MSEFIEQQSNIRLPIRKSAENTLDDQCIDYQDQQHLPVDLQLKSRDFVHQKFQKKLRSGQSANQSAQSLNKLKRALQVQQQQERQQIATKLDFSQNQSAQNIKGPRRSSKPSLFHDDYSQIHQTVVEKQKFKIQQNQKCKQQQLIKVDHVQTNKGISIQKKNLLQGDNSTNTIVKFRSKQAEKQCRICLQNQEQGKMIRPCICSGSINNAHQKCIRQWILRKTDAKGRKKVRCQVCDFQYKYKIVKNRQMSCEQYKKGYQNNVGTFRCFYSVMAILTLGLLAMIAVIILSATQGQAGQKIRNGLISTDSSRIIFACVVFIYFNIMLLAVILFAVEYAVKLQISIQDVLDIAQIVPKNKNKKLYPKAKKQAQVQQ